MTSSSQTPSSRRISTLALRRPIMAAAIFVLIALVFAACSITPPTVKVEVAGGTGQAASTTEAGSTEPQPGQPAGPAEGGENTGTLQQVNAGSAAAAAAAGANCKPQAVNEKGVTMTE